MVVLATLSRLVIDDVWTPEAYGQRARPVVEAHRKLEQGAWQLVEGVLTGPQLAELRDFINSWRRENLNVHSVANIRFRDFAMPTGSGVAPSQGSLLALFGLDPLAQLDPAVREFAQTRELAERGIFYLQRAPDLLNLQVEKLAFQFAVMPETKSLLASLDRASLVGTAADRLVGSLPDLLANEREALVLQVTQELDERSGSIGSLGREMRSTLQAGTDTANALHAALETVDRIAARLSPNERASRARDDSEPFDITEYTEMLRELTVTVRELQVLARNADTALPALRGPIDAATTSVERILDRAFTLLLVLVVVATVTMWAGAITYRAAVFRMQHTAEKACR
jgi:hypothetical protein